MSKTAKTLLIALIVLLSFVTVVFSLAWYFGNDIKQLVVKEVNKHIATPVKVGDIRFSLLRNFPKASVVFENVVFEESLPLTKNKLASFERIDITLNVWDVLRRKSRIKSIILVNGEVHTHIDKDGRNNFTVLKADSTGTGEPLQLNLENVRLQNITVVHNDEATANQVTARIRSLDFSGNFGEQHYTLYTKADMQVVFIQQGTAYLKEAALTFSTSVDIDRVAKRVVFDDTEVKLEKVALLLKGYLDIGKEQPEADIQFSAKQLDIASLLSLLPKNAVTPVEKYNSKGQISLEGKIKGRFTTDEVPAIQANFQVRNGSLYLREYNEGLSGIQLTGEFSNGKGHNNATSYLRISNFETVLASEKIGGKLYVSNFDAPYLDMIFRGNINVANLKNVVDLGVYNQSTGTLEIDLSVKGALRDLQQTSGIHRSVLDGKITGRSLNLGTENTENHFKDINARLLFSQADVTVEQLNGYWNQLDFDITGKAENLVRYLFNKERLRITGNLQARNWVFKNIKKQAANSDTGEFSLPDRIELDARVTLQQLEVEKFKASDIYGSAKLSGNVLQIDRLSFKALQGTVTCNGKWMKKEGGTNSLTLAAKVNKINIQQFFYSFNDFGQQEITSQNIKGVLTGSIDVGSIWDKRFNLKPAQLYTYADIRIENGELNNYAPLRALSRFVKVEELENIRFATMQNVIEIYDEQIHIPNMEIRNNALDLQLGGTHSFNNYVSYSLRMKLRDVLANSYHRTHVAEEEETQEGINLFLKMEGPADKIKISWDNKNARQNVKQQLKKEKQTAKEVLRKELGLEKKKEERAKERNAGGWEEDLPE